MILQPPQYARSWSDLPQELLFEVLHDLNADQLIAVRPVCKDWRDVSGALIQTLSPRRFEPGMVLRCFPNIESLNLSGSCNRRQLDVEAQQQLLKFRCLTCIDLRGVTQLQDRVLIDLVKQLRQLRTLSLAGCKFITDDALAHVQQLQKLESLTLSLCEKISDQGIQYLAPMTSLTYLDLSHCPYVRNGVSSLTQLSNLRSLNLFASGSKTGAAQDFSTTLVRLTSLTKLDLGHILNKGDIGETVISVASLPSLQWLDLSSCRLHDTHVRLLTRLSGLRHLSLAYSLDVWSPDTLAELKSMLHLTSLDFRGCARYVNGFLLRYFSEFYNLVSLKLSLQGKLRVCEFLAAKAGLQNLHSLELSVGGFDVQCHQMLPPSQDPCCSPLHPWTSLKSLLLNVHTADHPHQVLDLISLHLPGLHNLALHRCRALRSGHFAGLRRMTGLQSLRLYKVDIRDADLSNVTDLTTLTTLCLEYCTKLSEEALRGLSPLHRMLRVLSLSGSGVTSTAVPRILGFENLTDLNLSHNRLLTGEALMLLGVLRKLRRVNITNCHVTCEEVQRLSGALQLVDIERDNTLSLDAYMLNSLKHL